MRTSLLAVILIGFAAGPVDPAAGQQKEASETRQPRNLLGSVKALEEFEALGSKYVQAFNRNDAAAMAALYADDGIAITPDGWFEGHDAIQQWYESMFRRWQPSKSLWQTERLTGTDNEAWQIGRWFGTVQTNTGPVSATGLWSFEYVRVGNEWKIRSAAYNVGGWIALSPRSDASLGP